jgi:hypothetical protein
MPTRSSGETVALRIRYLGTGPVVWSGGRENSGLQDRDEGLHPGTPVDGGETFDLELAVTSGTGGRPVLSGSFAHGPPTARFLYLGWRNDSGAYARRLKLSLADIQWDEIRRAAGRGQPLVALVDDRAPRVTRGGVNIGGAHPVVWDLQDDR